MIQFFFENIDKITIDSTLAVWLEDIILTEGKKPGDINCLISLKITTLMRT